MIKKLLSVLYLISMMSLCDQVHTSLNEISIEEPTITVMIDGKVHALCRHIVDLWHRDGYAHYDKNLELFLKTEAEALEYQTVLHALECCINAAWQPSSSNDQKLVAELENAHAQLAEEYNQLIKQNSTRRIKCKSYTKVSAREIAACNARFEQLNVNNKLYVDKCLQVYGLDGIVQSDGGCLYATTQIGTDALEDGAITNSKLADNSVTSNKIVNNSLLPSHLLFNTVDTFPSEPDLLRLYRGTVTGNTGTALSGVGFTSSRTGTGAYTITFTQAYANANSYQIFVQPTSQLDRNVTIVSQLAGSFSITIVDNATNPIDQDFMFFTIGTMV